MAGFQTFVTATAVLGIMYFIVFVIWGAGGGFSLIYEMGKIMKQIPVWGYLVVSLIILTKLMFGGK